MKCQQMFSSQHDNNYFRVKSLKTIVDDNIFIDVIIEIKQQIRNAQRALKQRIMQELKNRQKEIEFVSFLKKMN